MNKQQLEQIIKYLRQGKFEMTGDEIIQFYNTLAQIITEIKKIDTPQVSQTKIEEPTKKLKKENK